MKSKLYNQISKKGFVKIYPLTCHASVIDLIMDKDNGFVVEFTDKGYLHVTC